MKWLELLGLAVVLALVAGCSDSDEPTVCVAPCRAERDDIHLLKLVGTPYEMGKQHGELMATEIAEGIDWLDTDPLFSLLLSLGEAHGLIDEALVNSYPDLLEECRGIRDGAIAAGVAGLTVEKCASLAYADVMAETVEHKLGAGCTQFVAAEQATFDGSLIHARNMDNGYLSYLIRHPTVILRQPTGAIPYLEVGFPGSVSPHSGMNAAGIAIASNENYALDDLDREGRSHIQMSRQILQSCSSLDEAESFLAAQDHTTAESLMISDGDGRTAAAFEMTANHMGIRRLDSDGIVYMTNHFAHAQMAERHVPQEPDASTLSRFARLEELLVPSGAQSLHGRLDVPAAISVLRDTHNPLSATSHPPDKFDGGGTIANNAALHSIVFVPERRQLWVALGEPPVPQRAFVGFSLEGLLQAGGLGETDPPSYPRAEW